MFRSSSTRSSYAASASRIISCSCASILGMSTSGLTGGSAPRRFTAREMPSASSTDRCEDVANVLQTLLIQTGAEERLAAGRVTMALERHEVTVGGHPVQLSAKEFELLHLLLRHQGKVVRRERLLQEVWGQDYFGDTRTLDTHIGWLRKKVEDGGGVRIIAVRGLGYRLDLRD